MLLVFFVISIVASFLCSLWEATLLSITPSYAQLKLREGSRTGHKLQAFKVNIDRPLAGDFEEGGGLAVNGIVSTPDGKTLIVGHSGNLDGIASGAIFGKSLYVNNARYVENPDLPPFGVNWVTRLNRHA